MAKRSPPSGKLRSNGAKGMTDRRIPQLETLSRVSQNIHTATDIRSVMCELVKSAMKLVDASEGTSGLMVGGKMVFSEYCNSDQCSPIDYSFKAGYGVPGYVMQTKKPYITNDAEHDTHVIPEIRQKLGFHSLVDVPIFDRNNNKLLGCFEIHNKKHEKTFDEQDMHMLELLAGTASIALENVQSQEALQASEARYHDLYDNAPDMFVSVAAETAKIRDCNQTLADSLGYSKKEIIGRPIFDMYHPDCMEDVKKVFRSFVTTGEVHDAELQLKRKDGSRIDVLLNVSAVRDENGKVLYSRSIWRDVTESKKAKDDLREKFDEIERMNRLMITRELKMEELRKEVKILKQGIAALRSEQEPT